MAGLASVLGAGGCSGGGADAGPTASSGAAITSAAFQAEDPIARAQLRERALDLLLSAATDENAQVRANALEGLSIAPARAEIAVWKALSDTNAGVRSVAAMLVGELKLAKVAASVQRLTQDRSPYVRASAIYGLRANGLEADPSELATLVLEDPSPRVRSHAAFILGELGEASALGLLRQAAKVSSPRASEAEMGLLRLQLAEAMIKLGDDGQVETVRAALFPSRSEELEIAALAAQIIGQVGDRGSASQLIYVTAFLDGKGNHLPAEVRLSAAASLAKLGQTEGGFIADEYVGSPDPAIRAQCAFVYGETGQRDRLGALDQLMNDPSPLVRIAAATSALRVLSRG